MMNLEEKIAEQDRNALLLRRCLEKNYPDSHWEVFPPHISGMYSMFQSGYAVFMNGQRVCVDTHICDGGCPNTVVDSGGI